LPIDKDFRERWNVVDQHSGHSIWKSDRSGIGVIHGSLVGVHLESCIGCMKCITACPTDVFEPWHDPSGRSVVDPSKEDSCILCLVCELICPTDAISIEREGGSDDTLDALLHGVKS
jgi:NAD-dependent dihydropyrimidine dehydrogenase PreA subunit